MVKQLQPYRTVQLVILVLIIISSFSTAKGLVNISPGEIIVKFADPPQIYRLPQAVSVNIPEVDALLNQYRIKDAERSFGEFYQLTGD